MKASRVCASKPRVAPSGISKVAPVSTAKTSSPTADGRLAMDASE